MVEQVHAECGTRFVALSLPPTARLICQFVGDNYNRPDPTALRRTFAGFATRISGTAASSSGHCETRGRFLIERPGPSELLASERTSGSLRDSIGTAGSLSRRLECEQDARAVSSLQANALGLFLLQDRWRRRRRLRYVQLLRESEGSVTVVPGDWSHLDRYPTERSSPPRIEPLPLRAGQTVRRAAEFPGLPVTPVIPLIAQSPAAALTRRALTTLLPSSSANRRKYPDLSCRNERTHTLSLAHTHIYTRSCPDHFLVL